MNRPIFISRLQLNPDSPAARRDLRDCNDMHRTVMNGFGAANNDSARRELGVLFRLEGDGESPRIVVQSTAEPHWNKLAAGYLTSPLQVETLPLAQLVPANGSEVDYLLVAQPSKNKPRYGENGEPRHSARVLLTSEEDQDIWLRRQLTRYGATALSVQIDRPERHSLSGRDIARTRRHFKAVQFSGTLRVDAADVFADALIFGFGPGKAYGLGLLSLQARSV
jgi:CRISPR system Cascade subunit CasE